SADTRASEQGGHERPFPNAPHSRRPAWTPIMGQAWTAVAVEPPARQAGVSRSKCEKSPAPMEAVGPKLQGPSDLRFTKTDRDAIGPLQLRSEATPESLSFVVNHSHLSELPPRKQEYPPRGCCDEAQPRTAA